MRSPLLKKLVLSTGSLVGVFLVAEVVARLGEPGPFSLLDRNPYLPHEQLPHVHRPGFEGRWDGTWYRINELGFRGPELAIEPAEAEYRVVVVGDSCTFGKGVVDEDSWPRQLEAGLSEALGPERTAVVANLGVNGYSGEHYRTCFLEFGRALEPDLVVVGYNLNDFPNVVKMVNNRTLGGSKGLRNRIPRGFRDALGQLALYRWVRAGYYEKNRERAFADAERIAGRVGEKEWDPAIWEEQGRYLHDIITASRSVGAEVAVFLFPYESQVVLEKYDQSPIEKLREVCDELEVRFVDLAEVFREHARATDPPRQLFIRGDRYHPNREGYEIVASQVLAVAAEEGWLKSGQ